MELKEQREVQTDTGIPAGCDLCRGRGRSQGLGTQRVAAEPCWVLRAAAQRGLGGAGEKRREEWARRLEGQLCGGAEAGASSVVRRRANQSARGQRASRVRRAEEGLVRRVGHL